MAEKIKFNPLTGDFDIVGVSSENGNQEDDGSVSAGVVGIDDGQDEDFNLVLKPINKHI